MMSRQTMVDRLGPASGVLSPLVALGSIVLATIRSATFTWTHSALSDLGRAGVSTAWLFNGGLIVGGVLAVPFGVWLFGIARNRLERAGSVVFWFTGIAMAGIGAFPAGTGPHLPAAVSFYLLLSCSLWLYGAGNVLDGAWRRGVLTVALGVVNLLAWLVWAVSLQSLIPGLAIPESVGATILGGWVIVTAVERR